MQNQSTISWDPNEKFEFTGREFETISKALDFFISTPLSPMTIGYVIDINIMIKKKLQEAIESGKATKVEDEVFKPEEGPHTETEI